MGPELTSVKSANAIRELLGLKNGIMHLGFSTIMQSTPELAIPSECAIVPRVPPLGGSHHWGRVAPPIAALSGSPPKPPGSAGGYLLFENCRAVLAGVAP